MISDFVNIINQQINFLSLQVYCEIFLDKNIGLKFATLESNEIKKNAFTLK